MNTLVLILIPLFCKGFVLGDLEVLVAEAKKEAYRKIVKLWYVRNISVKLVLAR